MLSKPLEPLERKGATQHHGGPTVERSPDDEHRHRRDTVDEEETEVEPLHLRRQRVPGGRHEEKPRADGAPDHDQRERDQQQEIDGREREQSPEMRVQPETVQEAAELSALSPAEQGGGQRQGVRRDL